jgi:N6-adenosine-specific RNA methylase IME4
MIVEPGHTPVKFHPLANLFPMLSEQELEDLGEDIRANGQLEDVILHRDMILDGRNRYTAATRKGLAVRCEEFKGSDHDALTWVISKNLKRRHLTESQRAMVAARIATLRLGANQHTQAAPIGAPLLDLGGAVSTPAPEPQATVSQSEAADLMNVGRRSVQRAAVVEELGAPELKQAVETGKVAVSTAAEIAEALPVEEQKAVAELSEKEILERAKAIRKEANDKRRAERADDIRKKAEASTALPTGRKFPLIYLDPPTKFAAGDSDRSTENHYPTMTEEEIAALPIADLALDKCVMLIWTTVPWLEKTLRLIKGWGFDYKSCAVWDKVDIGLGYWWQNQHEILIAATRGDPVIPENGSILGPSLYREKRGRHSAKPEYFRQMIDGVPEWKDWPKVELFPRVNGALPQGWFGWGNEANVPAQQSLGIDGEERAA